jgi:hypothetical protein
LSPVEKIEVSFVTGRNPILDGRVSPIQDSPFDSPKTGPRQRFEGLSKDTTTKDNPSPFAKARMLAQTGVEETKEGSFENQLQALQNIAKGKKPVANTNQNDVLKKAILTAYYKKAVGDKTPRAGDSAGDGQVFFPKPVAPAQPDEGWEVPDDVGGDDCPGERMKRFEQTSTLPPSKAGRLDYFIRSMAEEDIKDPSRGQKGHHRTRSEFIAPVGSGILGAPPVPKASVFKQGETTPNNVKNNLKSMIE